MALQKMPADVDKRRGRDAGRKRLEQLTRHRRLDDRIVMCSQQHRRAAHRRRRATLLCEVDARRPRHVHGQSLWRQLDVAVHAHRDIGSLHEKTDDAVQRRRQPERDNAQHRLRQTHRFVATQTDAAHERKGDEPVTRRDVQRHRTPKRMRDHGEAKDTAGVDDVEDETRAGDGIVEVGAQRRAAKAGHVDAQHPHAAFDEQRRHRAKVARAAGDAVQTDDDGAVGWAVVVDVHAVPLQDVLENRHGCMKADSPGSVTDMFDHTRIACLAVVCAILPIGCLLFAAGTPCSVDGDCAAGEFCVEGFCDAKAAPIAGEGEGEGEPVGGEGDRGEGEGDRGEGEGDVGGEGEGDRGEGEGDPGEGEGDVVGGEGEGEPPPPTVFLCDNDHPQPAWFDLDFAKRIPIGMCDDTAPAGVVTGVVVPIFFVDGVIAANDLRADRFDILVVDHRTNTALPYERVLTAMDGALIAVRLPAIDLRSKQDDIWVYYSNAASADIQNIAMTYSDFQALWHFDVNVAEVKTGLVGSGQGDSVALVGGPIVGASEHAPNGRGFRFLQNLQNSQPTTVALAQGTISALVGPPSNGAFTPGHVVMFSELQTSPSAGLDAVSMHLTIRDDNSVGFYYPSSLGVGAFTNNSAPNVFNPAVFNHVAVAWTGTSSELVVNGGSAGVRAATNQANFPIQNTVLGMSENNNSLAQADNIGGRIDELRVHAVARSAAYLRAEHQGYLNRLQVFGEVENRP
jgi:hypothetical protein